MGTPLPMTGLDSSAVVGVAERWVDMRVAKGTLARVHVKSAALVGDVAIAYLVPGSDVPSRKAPQPQGPLRFLVLAQHGGHWRVLVLI